MLSTLRPTLRIAAFVTVLTLALGLETVVPQAAGYRVAYRRTVAPGIVFTRLYDPSGPNHIFVLDVDLSKPPSFHVAVAPRSMNGIETTSAMAAQHGAIAAVNGDFGGFSGRPTHLLAQNGALKFTSVVRWGFNVAVSHDEKSRYVGLATPAIRARLPGSSVPLPVDRWNSGPPGPGLTAGYSPTGVAHSPGGTCGVQLRRPSAIRWTNHKRTVSRTYTVAAEHCGSPLHTKGTIVLAAGRYSVPATQLRRLRPGQSVRLTWTLGWRDVLDTIGGDPLLVTAGKAVAPAWCASYFCDRNPRTGIGFTAGGHLMLVVVDGRRDGWSDGMTLLEFANLFVYLGATRALNLDGGGSSTMVIGGKIVNRPSDPTGQRPVSSAVLVMSGARARTRMAVRSALQAPASGGSPRAALMDPGSTGGLLDALAHGALRPPRP